jgi:ankyrin repeat protein
MKSVDSWTLLHLATQNGHLNVVERLLQEKGVSADIKSVDGQSFLHLAVYQDHSGVVHALVRAGGDPKLLDPCGRSTIDQAFRNSRTLESIKSFHANCALTDPVIQRHLEAARCNGRHMSEASKGIARLSGPLFPISG